VEMAVCEKYAQALLWYLTNVPTYCALSYALLFNENLWHHALFFVGSVMLVTSALTAIFIDLNIILQTIIGAFAMSYVSFFYGLRCFALHQAARALDPYKRQFEIIWGELLENEKDALDGLAKTVRRHRQRRVRQPPYELEHLFILGEVIDEWYQNVVSTWAAHMGLKHKGAPLKKRDRVKEKIERSYQGDGSRVLDFVRGCIITTSAAETKMACEFVMSQVIPWTVKNRYDPDYNASKIWGYRDINMQLSFDELEDTPFAGFVFELQIIHEGYLKIKSDGQHSQYILCRNLCGD